MSRFKIGDKVILGRDENLVHFLKHFPNKEREDYLIRTCGPPPWTISRIDDQEFVRFICLDGAKLSQQQHMSRFEPFGERIRERNKKFLLRRKDRCPTTPQSSGETSS